MLRLWFDHDLATFAGFVVSGQRQPNQA